MMKPIPAMIAPKIVTGRQPYRLVKALARGPEGTTEGMGEEVGGLNEGGRKNTTS